jgi:hypothetical protein
MFRIKVASVAGSDVEGVDNATGDQHSVRHGWLTDQLASLPSKNDSSLTFCAFIVFGSPPEHHQSCSPNGTSTKASAASPDPSPGDGFSYRGSESIPGNKDTLFQEELERMQIFLLATAAERDSSDDQTYVYRP